MYTAIFHVLPQNETHFMNLSFMAKHARDSEKFALSTMFKEGASVSQLTFNDLSTSALSDLQLYFQNSIPDIPFDLSIKFVDPALGTHRVIYARSQRVNKDHKLEMFLDPPETFSMSFNQLNSILRLANPQAMADRLQEMLDAVSPTAWLGQEKLYGMFSMLQVVSTEEEKQNVRIYPGLPF